MENDEYEMLEFDSIITDRQGNIEDICARCLHGLVLLNPCSYNGYGDDKPFFGGCAKYGVRGMHDPRLALEQANALPCKKCRHFKEVFVSKTGNKYRKSFTKINTCEGCDFIRENGGVPCKAGEAPCSIGFVLISMS